MKFGIYCCCLALTGFSELINASFVIQKMKSDTKSGRKSLQRGSVTRGRSLINSISQSANRFEILNRSGSESNKSRGSRKSRKSNRSSRGSRKSRASYKSRGSSVSRSSRSGYKSPSSHNSRNSYRGNSKSHRTRDSRTSRKSHNSRKSRNSRPQSSVNILSSYGKPGKSSFSITNSKTSTAVNRKSTASRGGVSFSYLKGSSNSRPSRSAKIIHQSTPKLQLSTVQRPSALKPTIKSVNNVTIDDFVYVDLPTNQWTEFYFSEVGQLPYSRWIFDIPANQRCTLQVVDSFCTGDRFEATRRLDNGVEIPLLSTPPVPYDPIVAEEIRLGSNVNCTPFTTDAETAWASSSWSKGEVALQPGNYKLILKSLLAPYGSGGAFVRLNCPTSPTPSPSPSQNVCTFGSSSIQYIRQSLSFTQQSSVCQSYGYAPLAVTASNIRDARNVLINCAGVDTRAWIASYNGDNYGGTVGLSLHALQSSEVGAITATSDTSVLQGVLCQ